MTISRPSALSLSAICVFSAQKGRLHQRFRTFCLKQRVYIPWYAVRPNEHAGTVRNVLKRIRGVHTEFLQPLDFVHIVNDFTIGINFSVFFRLLLGEVHGTAYAEANPAVWLPLRSYLLLQRVDAAQDIIRDQAVVLLLRIRRERLADHDRGSAAERLPR